MVLEVQVFTDGVKAWQWLADAAAKNSHFGPKVGTEKTQNVMSVLNLKDYPQ